MPEKIENGSIAVQDGKILKIGNGFTYEDICRDYGRTEQEKKADTYIDAGGNWVMPGIIEAHCHMGITEEKKGMEGDDCNETGTPLRRICGPLMPSTVWTQPLMMHFGQASHLL